MTPKTLVRAGDRYLDLTAGELSYLLRHTYRDSIFEFKPPYENEVRDLGVNFIALVEVALSVGWFVRSDAKDVVSHWARVDDLKAALASVELPTQGKRDELLAACLQNCPEWVQNFAMLKPGYRPTDKGIIELQATLSIAPTRTREMNLQHSREFFDRDLNDARQSVGGILGIRICSSTHPYWVRQKCPKAAGFIGIYLPDEVPELYPDDCPETIFCGCVYTNMVLSCDNTQDAKTLRDRIAARSLPEPPPTWEQQKAEVEAMEAKRFEDKPEELKAHRSLVKRIVDAS